jgi:multicomponent Na+:H+ antiporter subunit C
MILSLAVVVGMLFGGGTYLVLQRTLTRVVLGLALWGHAVNVLLLAAGGRAGTPPLIGLDPGAGFADPLPQAMALTAIVITFGITAFLLALAYRSWTQTGDDEAEDDIEDRRIAELARHPVPVEPVPLEDERL